MSAIAIIGLRPDCGTNKGYGQHRYRREHACSACLAAHSAAARKARSEQSSDFDITDRLLERFWTKVVKAEGCWPWTAGRNSEGYGSFAIGARSYDAHRVAYIISYGNPANGLVIDHACHSRDIRCDGGPTCAHRRCVNPAHLELVSNRENTLRGRSFAAQNAIKTSCSRGHAYDELNTYVGVNGKRDCRMCNAAAAARYKARQATAS